MSDRKQATLNSYFSQRSQITVTFEEIEKQLNGMRITNEPVPRISIFDFIEKIHNIQNPITKWSRLIVKHISLKNIIKGNYTFPGLHFF